MSTVAVIRQGSGPEVLLVHGGATPARTWSGLESLAARWMLASVYRRGFPPSPPPPAGYQDFDVDADDVGSLLGTTPHLVAHSYGALGALIGATRAPSQVRSLTLIEPALFPPLDDDPELARFRRIGEAVLTHGLETDQTMLREFLRIAGAPVPDDGRSLPESVMRGVQRARGSRFPAEANPPLEVLREAGIPCLVASGDHHPAIERMCDVAARTLDAERVITPGAGHFVAAAPGFAERLEHFLATARRP